MCSQEEYPDEQRYPVTFSLQERKLILHLYTLDGDMEERFRLGRIRGNAIDVPMNAYDMNDLLEQIAAAANHEKNLRMRRRLDRLYKKAGKILDSQFPL